MMKCYLVIGFMLCFSNTYSQQSFSTDTTGKAYSDALSSLYSSRNEIFLDGLKSTTTDKKLLKHYESHYKAIFKGLNEEIKEGQMIFIPVISAALEKIMLEIKTKNPSVPGDVQLFLLRDDHPNAITIGDNSIFVNLGLFYYLETEDQVASVLSHEVGHLMLKHTIKTLNYNYERDKESVVNVKALRETEVKKADRAFDLLKNSIYKGGKMRRCHEMQADSIGYVLHKNTRYQKNAFIEALERIELYDTAVTGDVYIETYKRLFDLPGQKFDDKWLQAEDFSSYNYKSFTQKLDKDSVSTHPETEERIAYLETIFPELKQKNAPATGTGAFTEIKSAAEAERMPNLYFNERYGEIVFASLLALQKNPADVIYKEWLGKGLQKIYEARRDYTLNKYLDRVAPKEQTASYMRFLNFMWNLKLDEINNMADFYTVKK